MARPVALMLAMAVMTGACSASSPAAPTPTSPVSGTWTGTVSGTGATRDVRFTLLATVTAGDTSGAAGRYESATSSGVVSGEAGAITVGANVSLILTPVPPVPCNVTQPFPVDQLLLNLTLDGTRMTGDGAVTYCGGSGPVQATFTKP